MGLPGMARGVVAKMWSRERHRRILSTLESSGQVSTHALADMLNVSRETVRRDLVELEDGGKVQRVHGGAMLFGGAPEAPFSQRVITQRGAKREIARKAVGLIEPGQCIMIDAGSTTAIFAQQLANLSGITVITNSLTIATTVQAAVGDIELLLLGGRLLTDVPATYGELTLSEIRRFRADLTFVAPVAVDHEGAHDFALHEAEIATAMMERADRTVVLADASKLNRTSRVRYCEPEQISILVTDGAADPDTLELLASSGIGNIL